MTLAIDKMIGCGLTNTARSEHLPKKTKVKYSTNYRRNTLKTEHFSYKGGGKCILTHLKEGYMAFSFTVILTF